MSEYDSSMRRARRLVGQPVGDRRLTRIVGGRWRYVHTEGSRPMLYDSHAAPAEFPDLGPDPQASGEAAPLHARAPAWARRRDDRVTVSDERTLGRRGDAPSGGIALGFQAERGEAARCEGRAKGGA